MTLPDPLIPLSTTGRPVRRHQLPKRYRNMQMTGRVPLPAYQEDVLPEAHAPLDGVEDDQGPEGDAEPQSDETGGGNLYHRAVLHVQDTIRTALNSFGIFHEYPYRPSFDPDASVLVEDLANFPCHRAPGRSDSFDDGSRNMPNTTPPPHDVHPRETSARIAPWPFKNMTTWRFMRWLHTGSTTKSEAEASRLVQDVFHAVDFDPNDLVTINVHRENQSLDAADRVSLREQESDGEVTSESGGATTAGTSMEGGDGWCEATVEIEIPTGAKDGSTPRMQRLGVPGLWHRSLTEIVKSAFVGPLSEHFHLSPFRRFWKSTVTGTVERLYDELYTSDAWLEAHDKLQKMERSDGCKLERVIAGMMFWSDATHLATFGEAKAWPVYVFFGNLSKYVRWGNGPLACHHVAYIPSVSYMRLWNHGKPTLTLLRQLPDSIHSFMSQFRTDAGKKSSPILTHCRRELFHAVWHILLDDEFVRAYRDGIVMKCADGITRRIFPRIFTYSADYPEK